LIFNKAAILGVGLLGASFSLAAKKHGLCRHVTGFGRNRENLELALGRGIIDAYAQDPASACGEADIILLASPAGSFVELVKRASSGFKRGAIVTDVGSVKGALVYEIENLMPAGVRFIGGHPIAGSDRSGIDFSSADLFSDALCIMTPTERSEPAALEVITEMWRSFGSRVMTMGPAEHDRIYAAVSHLPHLIAYAMVNTVSDIDRAYFSFCGQGFKDMTRIAASSPDIWTDISLMNSKNLLEMIAIFRDNLGRIEQCLKQSDPGLLKQELLKASSQRETLGQD
jgi:prephenate dehydrogenase